MNKGIILSIEATVSLLCLTAIIIASCHEESSETGSEEVLLLQKADDLLKIWAKKASFEEQEMASDFSLAFPQQSGKIIVNGKETVIEKEKHEAISTSMVFYSAEMQRNEVTLIVFH